MAPLKLIRKVFISAEHRQAKHGQAQLDRATRLWHNVTLATRRRDEHKGLQKPCLIS